MLKKEFKRILSVLLVLVLFMSLLPNVAGATDGYTITLYHNIDISSFSQSFKGTVAGYTPAEITHPGPFVTAPNPTGEIIYSISNYWTEIKDTRILLNIVVSAGGNSKTIEIPDEHSSTINVSLTDLGITGEYARVLIPAPPFPIPDAIGNIRIEMKNVTLPSDVIVTFNWQADEDDEQVDKTALGAAIAQATANKATVVVSVDGTDVEPEDKWVTQAEMDAYEAAITAAQAVYDNPNATQAEVDNAVSALIAATEAFNGAKKDGTKPGTDITPAEALSKVVDYYKASPPSAPSAWEAFVGLWGAGEDLSASPWPDYGWKTIDPGFGEQTSGNDHIYHIFSLLATGKNPAKAFETNRNLFAELASQQNQETGSFGNIGKDIFAIIALDDGTELGVDVGAWNEENRSKAVASLLKQQNENGSFGPFSQIDYTGWSLIVLSKSKDTHAEAINKAKQYLKSMQQDSGGFGGSGMWDAENCSSIACAIQGLIAIGEDISSVDGPWSKNGKTPIDALLSYQREDGSFKWQHEGTGSATNQAIVSLADIVNGQSTWYKLGSIVLDQEQVDKTALGAAIAQATANKATAVVSVDGTDVEPEDKWVTQAEMDAYEAAITAAQAVYDNPNATQAEVDNAVSALVAATEAFNGAKKDGTKYTFNVRIEANDRTIVPLKEVSISIADLDLSKYGVETNFTEPKPLHVIIKALESVGINCTKREGLEIGSGGNYIAGIDGLSTSDTYPLGGWMYYVNNLSTDEGVADYSIKNGDTIVMFFTENFMENIYSWFDIEKTQIKTGQELQLTLTGSYDDWGEGTKKTITGPVSDAAILVNEQIYKVNGETVKTDSTGKVTLTFSKPGTYHVTAEKKNDSGQRILTRPYCLVTVEQTPGSGGGGGGDITPPSKEYITFSVDKKTINKGYVIAPTQVELKPGDTVWSVLKRELDARNISYEYKWYEMYDSTYVQSIDGDGEFDHGPLSGWMYSVNGQYYQYGASQYVLRDGDVVQWSYSKNLGEDLGEDNSKWGSQPGSGVSDRTSSEIKVTSSTGTVSITNRQLDEAVKAAEKDGSSHITIKVETAEALNEVRVELPKGSVASLASQNEYGLKIETAVGNLSIPKDVLSYIAEKGKGDKLRVSLTSVDTSQLTDEQRQKVGENPVYKITIESGGSFISDFGGSEITISLPYTLKEGEKAGDVKVWYLNDAGELEQIDCTYDEKTGLATFKTSHLSYYVVGIEAEEPEKDVFVLNFTDVKESDWFYDAVKFAVEKGLFKGTGETTFSPHQPMTRAMLVTVLYNLEGSPGAAGANNFTDVKNGEWYTNAVIWANAKDIVSGYGKGLFGTNDPITREQMASILYRYASYKGYDVTATANLSAYTDEEEISNWAKEAMNWANAEGLITGRTKTTLVPGGTATRAEVASILKRFVESFME